MALGIEMTLQIPEPMCGVQFYMTRLLTVIAQ